MFKNSFSLESRKACPLPACCREDPCRELEHSIQQGWALPIVGLHVWYSQYNLFWVTFHKGHRPTPKLVTIRADLETEVLILEHPDFWHQWPFQRGQLAPPHSKTISTDIQLWGQNGTTSNTECQGWKQYIHMLAAPSCPQNQTWVPIFLLWGRANRPVAPSGIYHQCVVSRLPFSKSILKANLNWKWKVCWASKKRWKADRFSSLVL